jgi:hypothetical protein
MAWRRISIRWKGLATCRACAAPCRAARAEAATSRPTISAAGCFASQAGVVLAERSCSMSTTSRRSISTMIVPCLLPFSQLQSSMSTTPGSHRRSQFLSCARTADRRTPGSAVRRAHPGTRTGAVRRCAAGLAGEQRPRAVAPGLAAGHALVRQQPRHHARRIGVTRTQKRCR